MHPARLEQLELQVRLVLLARRGQLELQVRLVLLARRGQQVLQKLRALLGLQVLQARRLQVRQE